MGRRRRTHDEGPGAPSSGARGPAGDEGPGSAGEPLEQLEPVRAVAGDEHLEVSPDGTVIASRAGRRDDYIAAAVANAFPAVPARSRATGDPDPGVPAAEYQQRAARYAAWRWDAFHRGEIAGL